jgi:hypothetical protein
VKSLIYFEASKICRVQQFITEMGSHRDKSNHLEDIFLEHREITSFSQNAWKNNKNDDL